MDIIHSGRANITSLEQTIVDSIADFEKVAGLEETLCCIMLIPALDEEKLLRILEGRNSGYPWQKCGHILEEMNDGLGLSSDFFKVCHDHISGSKRALIKETAAPLIWNKKWNLYVSESLRGLTDQRVDFSDTV